jgi:hypothetical protein
MADLRGGVTGVVDHRQAPGSARRNSPPAASLPVPPHDPRKSSRRRARYEWSFNDYLAFVQLGGAHQAHSLSVVGNAPSIAPVGSINQAYDQPSHTTYDGALGLGKEAWTAQIYGQNVTDTRGKTFISSSMAIETQTVIRPRVVGLRFSHKF